MDPNRPPMMLPAFGGGFPILHMQAAPMFQQQLPMHLQQMQQMQQMQQQMQGLTSHARGLMQLPTTSSSPVSTMMLSQASMSQPPQPQPMLIAPSVSAAISAAVQSEARAASAAAAADKPLWTEHKAPDGRVYFYNRDTKQSSWTKPDDLKTPEERLLSKCPWKEYKTTEGKVYFYNVTTKVTTWTIPKELEELKEHADDGPKEDDGETSELEKAMLATMKTLESAESKATEDAERQQSPPPKHNAADPFADHQKEVKKRQVDRFKELLRDKYNDSKITSTCSWEHAVKYIQHDPRFRILNKVSEKKQIFNAWKTQRQKEERDEKRLAAKQAKDDLEKWLQVQEKMTPRVRYKKAEEWFGGESIWKAVNDSDRKEIFRDVQAFLEKQEKENAKVNRRRNIKALADILDGMDNITYRTTWAQAQRLLIENPSFAKDESLQNMDKEDALIVFEEHIRALEKEDAKEREQEQKRLRRQQRKNREAFLTFLQDLHKRNSLTSISLWCELYPVVSADQRFHAMLGQPGSTPLDLFKFYVEDLKSQYGEDRRIIKDILKDKNHVVETDTTFEQFQKWIVADERAVSVDTGNMKLCYSSFIEKAEAREKERQKEDARKRRRLESAFRSMLKQTAPPIDPESKWDDIRSKIADDPSFLAIDNEQDRKAIFNDYVKTLAEACGHHHGTAKKKKKDKKKRKKPTESSSESEPEAGEVRPEKHSSKKRKRKTREDDEAAGDKDLKKVRKSKSKKRHPSDQEAEPSKKKKKAEVESDRRSKRSASLDSGEVQSDADLSEGELERKRRQLLKALNSP